MVQRSGWTWIAQGEAWMQNDLLQDWQTIWQSELAAMAVDREAASLVASMAKSWADMATVMQAAAKGMADGGKSTDDAAPVAPQRPAPRAAAAADASGAGSAEIAKLHRRVAELERRLAEADRRDGPVKPRGKSPRG
jgi:hypothetical protein